MKWYWACWLTLGFGVPETIALLTKHPENTLSEVTWRWFDIVPGRTITQWGITQFVLLAFLLWLLGHLGLGLWRTLR